MNFQKYYFENELNNENIKISFDKLKKEVQNDIANILKNKFELFNNPIYFHNNDAISDFIKDTPNIYVYLRKEDPEKLFKQFKDRYISKIAVNKYIDMIKQGIEFDPVLVSGENFIDGGHRVVAYMKVGKKIPTVDISEILNFDWNNEIKKAGLYMIENVDDPRPPISKFKKIFFAWNEDVQLKFVKAVNRWHGTTIYDYSQSLLINFAKQYPKEMEEYQAWLKSLSEQDYIILYRGFSGKFADELAEKTWNAIKNKEPYIEIELSEYSSWTTNKNIARIFSDVIIIKHEWHINNIFHAEAGRGFLRQTKYKDYIKLGRTEREVVIKHIGTIKVDPINDIILRGKYRTRQLRLDKKEFEKKTEEIRNKLEVGKTYKIKKETITNPFWLDIANKGGLTYLGWDGSNLRFKIPDGSDYNINKYNFDWMEKIIDLNATEN